MQALSAVLHNVDSSGQLLQEEGRLHTGGNKALTSPPCVEKAPLCGNWNPCAGGWAHGVRAVACRQKRGVPVHKVGAAQQGRRQGVEWMPVSPARPPPLLW